jgi:hypothetical protein
LLVLLVVLSPAIYSYTTTMMQPSSLPLWPRSVEWLRQHHGNWLVDEAEHYYYSWKAPKKGGPQLKQLPAVALPAFAHSAKPRIQRGTYVPPRVSRLSQPLSGEGVWSERAAVAGGAPC